MYFLRLFPAFWLDFFAYSRFAFDVFFKLKQVKKFLKKLKTKTPGHNKKDENVYYMYDIWGRK